MRDLIKSIIFIIIISGNAYSQESKKILFSINESIYTSIDLDNRIKYLNVLTNNKINMNEKEIFKNFISISLFNQHAKDNGLNIKDSIIENIYNEILLNYKDDNIKEFEKLKNINNIEKKNILKNIRYDFQKKVTIEKILNNENIDDIYKEEVELFNIYDVKLNYFLFNIKEINNYERIQKIIDFSSIDKTKKKLSENKILYNYYSQNINTVDNLDSRFKKAILNNKEYFTIKNDIFLIGEIKKKVKNNIGLRYDFYQIESINKINKGDIICKNIKKFEINNNLLIKEFKNIDFAKVNNNIKDNLKSINDLISLKIDNKFVYIILCGIKYNKDMTKQIIFNEKLNEKIIFIEKNFVKEKKIKYNFKSYE